MKIKIQHGQGSHLTIDAFDCKEDLNSKDLVLKFLNELPNIIGMNKLTQPQVVEYKTDNEESGVTGFVIIAESHLAIHTYPKKNFLSADIFSCKEFNTELATNYVKEIFGSDRIETNTLHRGHSDEFDADAEFEQIKGLDINSTNVLDIIQSMKNIGFQATHLGQALDVLRKIKQDKARVFLSFTSNMVSSGLREIFAQLVKEKLVDVIITSVGSIEEDMMKSKKPFLLGNFNASDIDLHRKGINRIGNIFVPSDRYELFEDMIIPIFQKFDDLQKKTGKMVSPSELIHEIGLTLKDENSILYWASKNNIPVFCPGITDGALGLQVYFFKHAHKEFGIDVTGDMKKLADLTLEANKTAGIILGGGIAKHHLIGVNILRQGLDYAIYVSTGIEGDGSLSGARPKEAKSWSKIKEDANNVCVEGDATIIFPLLAIAMKQIWSTK